MPEVKFELFLFQDMNEVFQLESYRKERRIGVEYKDLIYFLYRRVKIQGFLLPQQQV